MSNEKRLIDANALKRKLVELGGEPDYQHPDEDWGVGVCMAEGIVDEMPTVYALEVVRCRDCKYWLEIEDTGGGGYCNHSCWFIADAEPPIVNHSDFCSYGERREGV